MARGKNNNNKAQKQAKTSEPETPAKPLKVEPPPKSTTPQTESTSPPPPLKEEPAQDIVKPDSSTPPVPDKPRSTTVVPQGSSFGMTLGILASMKTEFRQLEESLLFMHDQTSSRALLSGQDLEKELRIVEKQLRDLEKKMIDGEEEITLIYGKVHGETLKQELHHHVMTVYGDMIEDAVKEQVAACLAVEMPQELQDEVARTKTELDEAQRLLHNAQSQAANELLRENENEKMSTIYTNDGQIHEKYPKTLKELFGLEDAVVRELLIAYQVHEVTESKLENLNRFIQFCGVQYQMDDDDQVKLVKPAERS
ncbi:hypothetical protein ONZ45_g19260 [Pleurotus djamor]|nr:hypothetical protein ONZ45_g19260 [Pleurotus djamor]